MHLKLGKDNTVKGEGWALPSISCAQDTVGLLPSLPLRLLGYGKPLPFNLLIFADCKIIIHAFFSFSLKTDALYCTSSNRVWVKCVTCTRTRVGKPALGFYESLKIYIAAKQTR